MAATSKIPEGYQTVMPYIILKDAAKFIAYTKAVFNATEKRKEMRSETVIAHAEIVIGDCTIMFADSIEQYEPQPASLFVYVNNADETYKKALAEGSLSISELSDREYGRTCGVQDPCGNTWWITSVK